jgi:hypothetical protein
MALLRKVKRDTKNKIIRSVFQVLHDIVDAIEESIITEEPVDDNKADQSVAK